jgi:hypothetical protein
MNENTGELVGHLVNISPEGFKMESRNQIPLNLDIPFRIELPSDVSDKSYMVFIARSKWCQKDNIDPTLYDVGFEIIEMNPGDMDIFKLIFEKYGTQNNVRKTNSDYLWGH